MKKIGKTDLFPGAGAKATAGLVLAGVILGTSGCGGGDGDSKSPPPEQPSQKSPEPDRPDKPQRDRPPNRKPPNAVDAVTRLLRGIEAKRPQALWVFLPASYQRDVNETVRIFARKMDPELWTRTFEVGRRLVRVGRTKREAILDSPAMQSAAAVDPEALAAEWDAALSLAGMLLTSELSDLEQLRRFDGGKFLSLTGTRFFDRMARLSTMVPGDAMKVELQELGGLQAKLVSEDGDEAVVEISLQDSDEPGRRVNFVRVEGKWIPETLAENWKPTVDGVRKQIDADLAPDVLQARKKQVLANLAIIEQSLDELEKTNDADAFQKTFAGSAVEKVMVGVLRSMMRPNSEGGPSVVPKDVAGKEAKDAKTIAVTVIVDGLLDAEAAENLADKLFSVDKQVDVGAYQSVAGTTRYRVSSVSDFEAFRKSLTFVEVVSADAGKREIHVRLPKSRPGNDP